MYNFRSVVWWKSYHKYLVESSLNDPFGKKGAIRTVLGCFFFPRRSYTSNIWPKSQKWFLDHLHLEPNIPN